MFNKEMSYVEALNVLFSAVEGKSEAEQKAIIKEYKSIVPFLVKNELKGPPAMTSYAI